MSAHRLSRHRTTGGPRWAYDGHYLPERIDLSLLLGLSHAKMEAVLAALPLGGAADDPSLAPLDAMQEVWASGVTYLRSRDARKAESNVADVYERVYDAVRPELFFKSIGWRVIADGDPIRVRKDSRWNVPEPELVLVVNSAGEIVGYGAGDDVSSRDIEGENPLYLPQAKVYDGSCALGPALVLAHAEAMRELTIELRIERGGAETFRGSISTSQMKRDFADLARYLHLEYALPAGALLMTGTGIVPPDDFSLTIGDRVAIAVGEVRLVNPVGA